MFADFEWPLPDLKTQNFLEWFAWPIATALYSIPQSVLYYLFFGESNLQYLKNLSLKS